MADFSSALYLGMRHPAVQLHAWPALTLGQPAALRAPPGALRLARELAALQGCQAATLLPSTLHLFWDLFGMFRGEPLVLLVDAAAYPVARWGAERAAAAGMPLQRFPHGAVDALAALAGRWRRAGRRPLILADGYSPGQDGAPPLARYAELAAEGGGYLLLDDTQVLGLCGAGGGGSLRQHGLAGPGVLLGASLAKGLGAPLAVLSGSAGLLARFEQASLTRRHSSPPSLAAIAAGFNALRINRARGDALRLALAQRVRQWRDGLAAAGIACGGGSFPVQTVPLPAGRDPLAVHAALQAVGIVAVPQQTPQGAALSFLLRADHSALDIDRALAALVHQLRRTYEAVV